MGAPRRRNGHFRGQEAAQFAGRQRFTTAHARSPGGKLQRTAAVCALAAEMGLTQASLANLSGLSRATVIQVGLNRR